MMDEKYQEYYHTIFHIFDLLPEKERRELLGKLVEKYPMPTKWVIGVDPVDVDKFRETLTKMWNKHEFVFVASCGHECDNIDEDGILSCCVCVDNTAWCDICLMKPSNKMPVFEPDNPRHLKKGWSPRRSNKDE